MLQTKLIEGMKQKQESHVNKAQTNTEPTEKDPKGKMNKVGIIEMVEEVIRPRSEKFIKLTGKITQLE